MPTLKIVMPYIAGYDAPIKYCDAPTGGCDDPTREYDTLPKDLIPLLLLVTPLPEDVMPLVEAHHPSRLLILSRVVPILLMSTSDKHPKNDALIE